MGAISTDRDICWFFQRNLLGAGKGLDPLGSSQTVWTVINQPVNELLN